MNPKLNPKGGYSMHIQNRKPSLLVIQEDITDRERLEKSASDCNIEYCSLDESAARSDDFSVVMFHAADQKKHSLRRLRTLKEQFPDVPIAFLVRRDQAPQIGELLAEGANKCFVKRLFPNEVNRAMYALHQRGVDAMERSQPLT
jgi:DNA-binding NarL/FixJ family response regulator